MRGAFGALKWTPDAFWSSTITEFNLAIEGLNEANGAETKAGAPTDDELTQLAERYG